MTYAVILASGKGTRIKDDYVELPKQFRSIGDKPVLIHTLEKFIEAKAFEYIYITLSEEYIDYTKNLIEKNNISMEKIKIVNGGKERIDSIENAINAIKHNHKITEDDIVVIHDGVRPFVTIDIIINSIKAAKKHKAVVCAVPVSDTLLISESVIEEKFVEEIPKRSKFYKGQSPDTFNLKLLIEMLSKLSEQNRKIITGTSQVCTLNNFPVYMIQGDEFNFKLTTKSDLIIADYIAKGKNNNN